MITVAQCLLRWREYHDTFGRVFIQYDGPGIVGVFGVWITWGILWVQSSAEAKWRNHYWCQAHDNWSERYNKCNGGCSVRWGIITKLMNFVMSFPKCSMIFLFSMGDNAKWGLTQFWELLTVISYCWFHGSSSKGFSIVFPAPWLAKVESSQKSTGMWFFRHFFAPFLFNRSRNNWRYN